MFWEYNTNKRKESKTLKYVNEDCARLNVSLWTRNNKKLQNWIQEDEEDWSVQKVGVSERLRTDVSK